MRLLQYGDIKLRRVKPACRSVALQWSRSGGASACLSTSKYTGDTAMDGCERGAVKTEEMPGPAPRRRQPTPGRRP